MMCELFFQIIAFDELKTDYKNPIDQCNSLNPVSIHNEVLCALKDCLLRLMIDYFEGTCKILCSVIPDIFSIVHGPLCLRVLSLYWPGTVSLLS